MASTTTGGTPSGGGGGGGDMSAGYALRVIATTSSMTLVKAAHAHRIKVIAGILFATGLVFAVLFVVLSTYSSYYTMINDPNMKGVAWKLAFSRSYSGLYKPFINPNTANDVTNWYYTVIDPTKMNDTGLVPPCVFYSADPTGNAAACTMYAFLENNSEVSQDAGTTSCQSSPNGSGYSGYLACKYVDAALSGETCLQVCDPSAYAALQPNGWQEFMQYGMPFLMLASSLVSQVAGAVAGV
jgi:hypothetical protein